MTLASKLMLALYLLKLHSSTQLDEASLAKEGQIPPEAKSEIDLSFSKIERKINEAIQPVTIVL